VRRVSIARRISANLFTAEPATRLAPSSSFPLVNGQTKIALAVAIDGNIAGRGAWSSEPSPHYAQATAAAEVTGSLV